MLKPTPCSSRNRSISSGSSAETCLRRRIAHARRANFGSSIPNASAPKITIARLKPVLWLNASTSTSVATAISSRSARKIAVPACVFHPA
ncbi:hypothetical protein D3C71_1613830 [compost metagenome]